MELDLPGSPWGSEDQVGAANHLSEELVRSALGLATSGRVFDLSLPISMDSPRHPIYLTPYFICLNHIPWASEKYEREEMGARNGIGWAQERIELDMHIGTHVDALGHATIRGMAYNRFPLLDVYGNWGLLKLGIEHLPPLITRGVLVDVPGHLGRELEIGEVITTELLRSTLAWEGMEIRRGDLVLVRTGWAKYYGIDNERYMAGCPGIGLGAAEWLAGQGVVAVGADQAAVEVWPAEVEGDSFPVHQHLLVRSGVYLVEQAQLDEIARERVYEFLVLCLTPKFVGATGSPVRLLAVT